MQHFNRNTFTSGASPSSTIYCVIVAYI